jgi:hypothetical protein
MDKKLTLSLDQGVIEKAKRYAKRNKTSLSKMIESYFASLTSQDPSGCEIEITQLVESLTGVIQLPDGFDYKKARAKHLSEKYK